MKVDYQWKLIDQIAASILILDSEGEICYLNVHARDLLGFDSEAKITSIDFSTYLNQDDQQLFANSLREVFGGGAVDDLTLCLNVGDGEELLVSLSGKPLDVQEVNDPQSIWTISSVKSKMPGADGLNNQNKLEDLQWLANQGRNLLLLEDWSEILYQASTSLQEKLEDCIVLTLTMLDDFNLHLDGIFGIENQMLNQVWKLLGRNFQNHIFPVDDRFRDTYSKRRLFKHSGGLDEFAISQVPEKVSKLLSQMIGLKEIYTIGLEGKHEVLGCIYILTVNDRLPIKAELVESFAFQVALALEKSKYARDLEISENQFQTIFEYAPDGYYISDFQGKFLNGNKAAEKISGYSRDELIGKSFLKTGLLSLDQIPKAATLLAMIVAGKSIDPTELDLIRKDGSVVPVEISAYPAKMGDKSVLLGIARDISQRRESDQALMTAHQSLTHVLEGIDAHVYVVDFETHEILYMNKQMIEDYGGNYEGKLCYKTLNGLESACSNCSNPQLLDRHGNPGEVIVWEGQTQKNNRWYRNYDRAISWTDQRLARMQIAVDITDNKLAANSLEQSEERYRSLFETSHTAIMTISPPDWRFTSGNSAMLKTFGLDDVSQFLTMQPWQLSPEFQPDGQLSSEKAREMIEVAIEKGTNYFSWTHKRYDGEDFPATVHLKRVDLKDHFFLQATVRDITEQVISDGLLEQKMEDLALLTNINTAANEGMSLKEILALVSRETERLFSSRNTTVYLLNDENDHLKVNLLNLNNSLFTQLEKIAGISLPEYLEIPMKEDGLFHRILGSPEVTVLSKQEEIYELVYEFLNSTFLSERARRGLKKLMPKIYRLIGINSVLVSPLLSAGKPFGFLTISRNRIFEDFETVRIQALADQLSGFFQKISAEEERIGKLNELELINSTFVEGSRLDNVDEICKHLADKIYAVNPDCYVMVNLYDQEINAIRVRALKGLGKKAKGVFKLMGADPAEFVVKIDDSTMGHKLNNIFTSGKLELVPGGMYGLSRGTIPRSVCKSIERYLGVGEIYVAGFGMEMLPTGGLVFFVKEGKQINYPAAIETIANHFSVIFERRQVQSEIVKRQNRLEALRDVELEIASELDIESLLKSISEKAKAIVDASACGFSIYNPDRNVLEYTAYTGFEVLPEVTDVHPGDGLSGRVWESKETLTVENYKEWDGRLENWTNVSNFYLAGIPVSWGDEILGVLEVALVPGESLSPNELETLELFATQAAIALKNARLFRDEKLGRMEADTLREIGVLINRLIGQPELLDKILSSLQNVVSYSSASIQLVSGSEIIIEAYLGEKSAENIIGTTYQIDENEVAKKILLDGENIILGQEADVREILDGPNLGGIKSWLAVPLESKGQRIGILTMDHTLPEQFSIKDADLVKDFAVQAVVALENNRLFDEIRRRTIEIEAVYDSALALTKELHPDALFEDLYQQIDPLFSPDAYILAIYDQNSDTVNVAYATEFGERQPQAETLIIPSEEKNSLLGWIIRKKAPLLIGNVQTDSIPIQPLQTGRVVRSLLGVPILIGDRIIGALVVQSYQPNVYTKNDQRLIQLLGNQVAIALENSRLFDDAQRRLARLSSLREIDQAISGGTDLALTMDVLVDQLIHTLGVDAACVLAYKPANQTLEYVDAKGFRTKSLQYTVLKLGTGLAGKAALEQNLVFIPDLTKQTTSFQQSPSFSQEGFVTYLAQPLITKVGLVGVLEVFHRSPLNPDPEWFTFLDSISRLAAIAIDRLNLYDNLAKSNIELKHAYDATIEGWAKAIELRDGDTEGHSRRVEALTMNLARKVGVSSETLVHMRRGALLHDIGKMAIPDGILLKAGKLSDEEWLVMKKHPSYAYEMLSKIDYLKPALDIPTSHHERWDGSGYPQGLAGENIPLQARIFAVVDVWDALQADRPYREAWTEEKTIKYLKDKSGKEFDPRIVQEFLELIGKS